MELHRASIRSSAVHPSVVASTREEEEEEEEEGGRSTDLWLVPTKRWIFGVHQWDALRHLHHLSGSQDQLSLSLAGKFIISCSRTQPQDHMEAGQHHGTVLCAACGVQHAMGWPHTHREERRKEKEGGGETGRRGRRRKKAALPPDIDCRVFWQVGHAVRKNPSSRRGSVHVPIKDLRRDVQRTKRRRRTQEKKRKHL